MEIDSSLLDLIFSPLSIVLVLEMTSIAKCNEVLLDKTQMIIENDDYNAIHFIQIMYVHTR